jgi:hypothetical protein
VSVGVKLAASLGSIGSMLDIGVDELMLHEISLYPQQLFAHFWGQCLHLFRVGRSKD